MKKAKSSTSRDWNELDSNIWSKIFMFLSVVDLARASLVSKSWHEVSTYGALWKKFDLSTLSFKSAKKPNFIAAWRDSDSSARLTRMLIYSLRLANGNPTSLIFHFFVNFQDVHILQLVERTPNVQRLVLPVWNDISKAVISSAIRQWRGLASMTIPFNLKSFYILRVIGRYCENFTELKVTGNFDMKLARALVKHTPKLKVLSIRSIMVDKRALDRVLNELQHLEVVNLCHSLVMEKPPGGDVVVYNTAELSEVSKVSHLKSLLICEGGGCIRCKNLTARDPSTIGKGLGSMEVLWREDEIHSLAH